MAIGWRKLSRVKEAVGSRRTTRRFARLPWALTAALWGLPFVFGQTPDLQNELRAAAAEEQSHHYEEAATLYRRLLLRADSSKIAPSISVHVRTRLATIYFLLHRYRESLEAVAPLTSKNSGYSRLTAQTWLVQGLDQLDLGQLPQATVSLRQALALNPESGTARLALGDVLARSGHMEKAAREYEEQTRHTPTLPDAWYKLGLAYAQLATRLTQDVVRKLPESIAGQQLAAEDRLDKGDYLGAAGAFFRLLRKAPCQPQAHAELGATLLNLGYPKAAEEHFQHELVYDPDCPLARLGLAETAVLRSDWQDAISNTELLARQHPHELARLLELSPPGPLLDAWTKGKIRFPQGFAASAAGSLWQAWLTDSVSRPTSPGAGASSSCSNPSSKAMTMPGLWLTEACYERLLGRLRTKKVLTPPERARLAEAEFRLGHYQAARREAQRLLEPDPRSEWGIFWLNQSYAELAQDCFAKVASLNPDSARVHQMLAQYYYTHHYLPRAKTEYRAAIQLAPELPDLHLGLGTVYRYESDLPAAEKELQKTLQLAPASALAHYELGDTYLEERRWELAVDHLRRAMDDPTLAPKARLDLAKAEVQMGQVRQAVEELLPVLKDDKDGEIHYRLADLYRKLGDKARAQEALATFRRVRDTSLQADRAELEALEKERQRAEASNTPESAR